MNGAILHHARHRFFNVEIGGIVVIAIACVSRNALLQKRQEIERQSNVVVLAILIVDRIELVLARAEIHQHLSVLVGLFLLELVHPFGGEDLVHHVHKLLVNVGAAPRPTTRVMTLFHAKVAENLVERNIHSAAAGVNQNVFLTLAKRVLGEMTLLHRLAKVRIAAKRLGRMIAVVAIDVVAAVLIVDIGHCCSRRFLFRFCDFVLNGQTCTIGLKNNLQLIGDIRIDERCFDGPFSHLVLGVVIPYRWHGQYPLDFVVFRFANFEFATIFCGL
mmetsp:Transcript_8774/g.13551  ORF Transcript_8774/g.13551 Transcript_8774/m.13551 type:complete len:274 (-) Transcript_8774:548-1369(-)